MKAKDGSQGTILKHNKKAFPGTYGTNIRASQSIKYQLSQYKKDQSTKTRNTT